MLLFDQSGTFIHEHACNSGPGTYSPCAVIGFAVDDTVEAGSVPSEFGELRDPFHRYTYAKTYVAARGRNAPRDVVLDTRDFRSEMAAVDLRRERPTCREFVRIVYREMVIRQYKRKTLKAYMIVLKSFLRWAGCLPHQLDRESVKEYLLYMAESDKGASDMSVHLSAIRTLFDKFCFLDITLGIETPRRGRKKPVVLSKDEVRRLLEAAVTMRDKLLIGIMYATGLRVSEVVLVSWSSERSSIGICSRRSRTSCGATRNDSVELNREIAMTC